MLHRFAKILPILCLAIVASVYAVSAALTWPYTMDDAYISLRYAEHLSMGLGMTWNPGEAPVEGYSNFLWVVWMAVACRLPGDPMVWSKLLGAACGLATVILLAMEGRETIGKRWHGLLPAAFLGLSPMFAFWSVSGIEMPAFTLTLLLGVRGLRRRQPALAGPALAVASLLRPEGCLLAAAAGSVFFASAWARRDIQGWRTVGSTAVWVLGAIMPYQLWRWWRFGHLVANTVQAKWMPLGGIAYFLGDFAYYQAAHLLLAVFGFWAALRLRARGEHATRWFGPTQALACGSLVAAQAVVLSSTRPAMGFYLRLFWPVLPFLFLLSAIGIREIEERLSGAGALASRGASKRAASAAWGVAIPVVLLALVPIVRDLSPVRMPGAVVSMPLRRTAVAVDRILGAVHAPLASWLKREHPGSTVALTDCGLLPYESDLRIIDLWGLNDPEIARDGFDADRLFERRPDLLLLASRSDGEFVARFPMDAAVHSHPRLSRDYRHVKTFVWKNTVDGTGDYAVWVYVRSSESGGGEHPESQG